MALVQPLTGEITDQLNLLIVGETHDDLLIQRIKRSIEKIRPHDIQQYHMLSGMLYSILGDVESCIDSHEKSLRYSSDVMFLHNYAYSMKRLGLSEKAYELMARSFDSSPTSECFGEYLTATIFAGIFDSFEERLVKFAKSNPETSVDDIGDVRYINHVRQILEGAGVSEVSYRKALELADSVIASKRYMTESIFIERGSFDGV
ncbi:hypothetical protein, partial [Pseudomonas syringae]|uniref:hypothetical protein n=1 Tax=Pseudomonas syringae TaxID=317 RepID=UPI001FEED375